MLIRRLKKFSDDYVAFKPIGYLMFVASCLFVYFNIYELPDLRYFLIGSDYSENFESAHYRYSLVLSDPWTKREFYPPNTPGNGSRGTHKHEIGWFSPNPSAFLRASVPDHISIHLLANVNEINVTEAAYAYLNDKYGNHFASIQINQQGHEFKITSREDYCYETFHFHGSDLYILRMCSTKDNYSEAKAYFEHISNSLVFNE